MIKKILLTGDKGYIGTVLKKKLVENSYDVTALDIKRSNFEDINIFYGQYPNPDLVIHLAGIVGEPNCQQDINKTYKTNVEGTNNIINYCKENNIPFLMASTCSVYGKAEGIVDEKSQLNPLGIYAITKMMNENKIKEELDNYIICRFGTIYGDSPEQRYDLVINGMTKRAIEEDTVTVFGGKQRRPFISTGEVSNSICELIKEFDKGNQKEIYNLVAFNKSILDIGKEISKVTDAKLEINELEHDERDYEVSNEKIKKIYEPKNTFYEEVTKLMKKIQNEKENTNSSK